MDSNDPNMDRWTDDRLASLRLDAEWRPDAARGLSLLRETLDADAGRRRRRAWMAGAVIAMGAGILAFPVTRAFARSCVDACVGQTSRLSSFLFGGFSGHDDVVASGFREGRDRKMAPDFALKDAAGKTVRLSDFRGQVVLLDLWATWCAPCNIEIPWFVEFQKTYRDRNVVVLGVSFDEEGWKAVGPYIESRKISYPVVIGNDEVSAAFGGVASLPTTFLIDKAGRIAVTHVGLCSKKDYEAEIRSLIEEHD